MQPLYFHCVLFRYDIMLECWQEKPKDRPTFKELHSKLHSILYETTVRINYKQKTLELAL